VTVLRITRGLPGSGKTTLARAWVAAYRAHRARVNLDDLRAMIDDSVFAEGVTEPRVIIFRDAAVLALLREGVSVICDDTNLPGQAVEGLLRLARVTGAQFEMVDLTGVPLDVCIARDAARTGVAHVGEAKIRAMHERYLRTPHLAELGRC
jgi:predicted kinase